MTESTGKKKFGIGTLLTIILVLAGVGAVAALAYVVATPKEESFTEFYLLGLDGKATGYPSQLKVGQAGQVMVGISNREHESVTYRLEVTASGVANKEIGPMTLAQGEKWEQVVSFVPGQAGDKQKVEFLLYRQGQSDVYHRLSLWVDVQ